MFTSPKQRRKRKFSVVFVVVAKKRSLHVQNLSFFIYLLGSSRLTFSLPPPVRRCSQDLSMVRNPNTFLVKTPAIFSLDINVIQDSKNNELLRFSGNRHLGREEKKVRCFGKNIFFKETSRVE